MRLLLVALLTASLPIPAAHAAQGPPVTGVSHLALFAHDIEKSRAFYKQFLGFDGPFSLTNKDGGLHVTWIKINDHVYDPDGTRVELMEPRTVDGLPVPSSTAPSPKPSSPAANP
jgi:hypothetical protein